MTALATTRMLVHHQKIYPIRHGFMGFVQWSSLTMIISKDINVDINWMFSYNVSLRRSLLLTGAINSSNGSRGSKHIQLVMMHKNITEIHCYFLLYLIILDHYWIIISPTVILIAPLYIWSWICFFEKVTFMHWRKATL